MPNASRNLTGSSVHQEMDIKAESVVVSLVLLGGDSSGKTCLLEKYIDEDFSMKFNLPPATIGTNFMLKKIEIRDRLCVAVKLFDTCGMERGVDIVRRFTKVVDGVVLVYDISDPHSLSKARWWLQNTVLNGSRKFKGILVGTKMDADNRRVSREEGEKWAKELGFLFMETSARTGENVNEAFETLVDAIVPKDEGRKKGKSCVLS